VTYCFERPKCIGTASYIRPAQTDALTIVWRNPIPLVRFTRTLQLIISNELGAVYEVTAPDLTQEFEVIPGEVA